MNLEIDHSELEAAAESYRALARQCAEHIHLPSLDPSLNRVLVEALTAAFTHFEAVNRVTEANATAAAQQCFVICETTRQLDRSVAAAIAEKPVTP